MNTVAEAKAALRHQIRLDLQRLSPAERALASAKACAMLFQQPLWQRADTVLLYAPLPMELDISTVLDVALGEGKVTALLRYDAERQLYSPCQIRDRRRDLERGLFGVSEPRIECHEVSLNQLDLTLAPGVVFSVDGGRVGRGKGFYDRLLPTVSGVKCGVAFDQQLVPTVPMETHDVRLDCILTPTRWLQIAG
jgi:5-formyltetrahydrofolate cyclo-ligase